jgi:tetratricopeptide (TPR) repeat protein
MTELGSMIMVANSRFYRACIVASGALVLIGMSERPAAADDAKTCAYQSGDVAIAACTRAIKSGKYKGYEVAIKYLNRGAEWKIKKDYDRAFADYNEAIRLSATYAEAFYNRCIVYRIKEDYDHALADCNQAIKLGPTPNALAATDSTRLGDDRTISDYYSQRGAVYLSRKDYDLAIADFDSAIRLYPKDANTLYNRGRAYQAKGDTARADADFETAKQLDK